MQEKAIVIGGGIAGLLAVRVLSDYFEDVVLIEKDTYKEMIKLEVEFLRQIMFTCYLLKERKYSRIFFQN